LPCQKQCAQRIHQRPVLQHESNDPVPLELFFVFFFFVGAPSAAALDEATSTGEPAFTGALGLGVGGTSSVSPSSSVVMKLLSDAGTVGEAFTEPDEVRLLARVGDAAAAALTGLAVR